MRFNSGKTKEGFENKPTKDDDTKKRIDKSSGEISKHSDHSDLKNGIKKQNIFQKS